MNAKKLLMVVFALVATMLLAVSASAVVWDEAGFVWKDNNAETISIENGESVQYYSGDFGAAVSPNTVVTAKAELINAATGAKKPVYNHNFAVCNGCENPFFIDTITPSEYNNEVGTYYLKLTLTDNIGGNTKFGSIMLTVTAPTTPVNHAPVANFNYEPQPVLVNQAVAFDGTLSTDADNDALTYSWDLPGTATSTQATTSYTFTVAGTYNIKLTVTDVHGATDSITKQVVVQENINPVNQPPVANFDYDSPVYVSTPTTFTSTSTDDGLVNPLSYTWFVDNVQQNIDAASVSITFPAAGTYQVTLIVNDGELSDDITKPVVVSEQGNACPSGLGFTNQPASPNAGQAVSFTGTAADADGDALTYSWDFNYNGVFNTDATGKTVSIIYTQPGTYTVAMRVNDGSCSQQYTKDIVVGGGALQITSLTCFNPIVVGHEQSCSIGVKNNVGSFEPNVNVNLYYIDGTFIGTCKTMLAGKCQVMFVEPVLGSHTVYATAEKAGFGSDMDKQPTFTYEAYEEAYDIQNLETYGSLNDMNNDVPKDTFYRGEPLFVKFQVVDINTGALSVDPNVVTSASLVSMAGGVAWLEKLNAPAGWFYYQLIPIPLNHEYYGESQAFAFAFNFVDQTGGQEYVDLMILNNPPQIQGLPNAIYVPNVVSYTYPLEAYEYDLEDNKAVGPDGMSWEIVSAVSGALFTADLNGKDLVIQPVVGQTGSEEITLRLYDLDGSSGLEASYAEQKIKVYVGEVEALTADITADAVDGMAPLQIHFDVNVNGGETPYTYSWDFGDGSAIVVNKNPVHTFLQPGQYLVTLTVTDSAGNTATDTIAVTATSEALSVKILTNGKDIEATSGGVPMLLTFTSMPIGGFGELSYLWIIMDIPTQQMVFPTLGNAEEEAAASQKTLMYDFTNVGQYRVYSVVSDQFGNIATDFVDVTTEPDQLVSVVIKAVPQSGNAPLNVEFEAEVLSGNSPFTYAWDLGDGTTSTEAKFAHVYEKKGEYNVVLKVVDGDGDEGEAVVTISVDKELTKATPRKVVGWTNLKLLGGEVYAPGDMLELLVNFKNKANWDLENVKVTATIPELGIKKSVGPFDLGDGQEITKLMHLELPYYTTPGEYDIRVVINTDGDEKMHRIKHRRIIVE